MQRTSRAILWVSLLNEPLISLYSLLPFILLKEMQATPFQLAIFVMVKPVVSIFSLYWSHGVSQRKHRLRSNVVGAGVLACLPFFLFPLITNAWQLIAAASLYWLFLRGAIPAWMEILRRNLPSERRNRAFSMGSIFGYAEGAFLALSIGPLMDYDSQMWRWIFPVCALFSLGATLVQFFVPVNGIEEKKEMLPAPSLPFREAIKAPWTQAWQLMGKRHDFFLFQLGFMMCGFAIMLMKPAEPIFCEYLGLSYTDLAVAILICKGLGYIITSPLWASWMARVTLYQIAGTVCAFVALCYGFFLLAMLHEGAIYVAYFFYGVWMAGSHLSWNLSGPLFAKDQESSAYSSVNVATVGLRGLIAPPLGSLVLVVASPVAVILCGMFLSLFSAFKLFGWARSSRTQKSTT